MDFNDRTLSDSIAITRVVPRAKDARGLQQKSSDTRGGMHALTQAGHA